MKRNVLSSKYEHVVDDVEFIECNPKHAHVRLPDGGEETVFIYNHAPKYSHLVLMIYLSPL